MDGTKVCEILEFVFEGYVKFFLSRETDTIVTILSSKPRIKSMISYFIYFFRYSRPCLVGVRLISDLQRKCIGSSRVKLDYSCFLY